MSTQNSDLVNALGLKSVTDILTALMAPREASITVSAPHAAGSFFLFKGTLYQAGTDIAAGDSIVSSGNGKNCEAVTLDTIVTRLKAEINFDEYLINDGEYTIKASDLEIGQWSYSTKNATLINRASTKFLLPVRAGMKISYTNTTYDVFFGVLETMASNTYKQVIGWKTDANGTANITQNGWLTFVVRNHADNSATVDPADFDSVVTIKTSLRAMIDALAQ